MDLFRFILGGLCLLSGALIVLANYVRQISNYLNRNKKERRYSSPAPFIGPVLIILGYFAFPIEFSIWILFILLLDPDTVITIWSIPHLIKAFRE